MDTNFNLYKIYYFVCKFGSITKTANFLYVSQPSITKHIKNLEKLTGKKLIYKVPNGIELTPDGQELYNLLKDPVEKFIDIQNVTKTNDREITINIIAGYSTIKKFLLKTLSEFDIKYPNIKFEIGTYPFYESLQRLRDGKADLIFLNYEDMPSYYNDIIVNECYEVEDILIVHNSLKNQFPNKIDILDLNEYPLICKCGTSLAYKNIEKIFLENNKTFNPKYKLSNNWLVEEYVSLGLGIGLVTKEFIENDLASGKVSEIKLNPALPKRKIGYAYRKNAINISIIDKFVNDIKKKVTN